MNIVYKGQNALRIRAVCGVDITGAQEKEIRHRKPDGTTANWDATVEDDETGIIYYDLILVTETALAGTWRCWSYIKFLDGRVAYGNAFEFSIREPGTML